MKALASFVAVSLFFALGAVAQAQTNNNNQNNNNNNNVTPIAPRISRPARIRDPILRLTPQQFIARADVVTNLTATSAPIFGSGPDGRVTLGEFIAALMVRNRGINFAQAKALFTSMDSDLDGFLTLADFNQIFLIPIGGGS